MLGRTFYHSGLKKTISVFGNFFNDIIVQRFDANENVVQSITVPLRYGPKEFWLAMLGRDLDTQKVNASLPMMSFEIVSLSKDNNRSVDPYNKIARKGDAADRLRTVFQRVPYKLGIELTIMSRNAEDASQIIEQIIWYFQNDQTVSVRFIPSLSDVLFDVVIHMNEPSITDAYDGDFATRRSLMWTVNFEVDTWFFGPVEQQGPIKKVQIDMYVKNAIEDLTKIPRSERVEILPGLTANGTPTSIANNSIPYTEIEVDDDYGFIENFYTFFDSKRYNLKKGRDEEIE